MAIDKYPRIGLFHKLFIGMQVVVLLMVSFQTMSQNLQDVGASIIEIIENGEKTSNGGENLLGGDGDPDQSPSIFTDIKIEKGCTAFDGINQKCCPWPDLFLEVITPPPEQ